MTGLMQQFMNHVSKTDGCWLWTASVSHLGYGRIAVNQKPTSAHRVAYKLFCGEIPIGMHVLHTCDVRNCVNPGHLYLGTQLENNRDTRDRNRRSWVGVHNGRSKFTEEQIVDIREKCSSGIVTRKQIAEKYGVTRMCIDHIVTRKSWSNVP